MLEYLYPAGLSTKPLYIMIPQSFTSSEQNQNKPRPCLSGKPRFGALAMPCHPRSSASFGWLQFRSTPWLRRGDRSRSRERCHLRFVQLANDRERIPEDWQAREESNRSSKLGRSWGLALVRMKLPVSWLGLGFGLVWLGRVGLG